MAKSAANLKFAQPVSNSALKSKQLPSRIKILGWGVNKTLDGVVILDASTAKVFYDNQKSIGRTTVPLDFNHNTVPGTRAYSSDKEPRAVAGYGVPTIYEGDGLYLEFMNWTPSGRKSARDYMDLSPTVVCNADGVVIGLHSCALTPAGQIENLNFYSADDMEVLSADSIENLGKKSCVSLSDMEHEENEEDEDETEEEEEEESEEKEAREKGKKKSKKHTKSMSSDDHFSKYGDVEYADEEDHKYPINTEAHVRAAWSYIHMPKNQHGMSPEKVSAIKHKIAAKAKKYGIELKANSADKVQVNAYVDDPYKGVDNMLEEHLEHFRKALGMDEKATPDDIMKKLRAEWEGMQPDKQVLPEKTQGGSVDPTVRGGPEGEKHEGSKEVHGTISYSSEDFKKSVAEVLKGMMQPLSAELAPIKQEIETLRTERNNNVKKLEEEKRKNLVDSASREGKVIPLSAEEIAETPIKILESIVANLKAEVPLSSNRGGLRALSADGTIPSTKGARERAASNMTHFFKEQGLRHEGPANLSTRSN